MSPSRKPRRPRTERPSISDAPDKPGSKRRALLSVADKHGLAPFALALEALGFEIVSTGGTATALRASGVIVTDVADNSLAAQQDIQREDVITEVDGKPVTNVQSFREALTKADPRRGVLLYLDRKGSKTFAVLKAGG